MNWFSILVIKFLLISLSSLSLGNHLPVNTVDNPTFFIQTAVCPKPDTPIMKLRVMDNETEKDVSACFFLEWEGDPYIPEYLDDHGIHFTTIHTGKKQRKTVLYTRGRGPVSIPLPMGTGSNGRVWVKKGYQYLPVETEFSAGDEVTVRLKRWSDISLKGWSSMDPHLHFERTEKRIDPIWFEMIEADGLDSAVFMVLKGGNFDGVWARQGSYGRAGIGKNKKVSLIPGEEFRGVYQGHHLLFLPGSLIKPISVGGIGQPAHLYHWPNSYSVLNQTYSSGGIGGAAHGGTFGQASTVALDALLGASKFIELSNTHLYRLDVWYRLLNSGVFLPPVAGTDLPNNPFREPWQPFLGETRTYVQVEDTTDFEKWKTALENGKVFVSSGPIINLKVNGQELGSTIQLPKGGGEIEIEAEISSSQPILGMEIVHNGTILEVESKNRHDERGVFRQLIHHRLHVNRSGWFAARGKGGRKNRLLKATRVLQHTIAHTAAIRVLVGDGPIRVTSDVERTCVELQDYKEKYRLEGKYPSSKERDQMLELFHRALTKLECF